MPTATRRLRTYGHERTLAGLLAQFEHVRKAVRGLTAEQFALPTRLGTWTVRDLAAHLSMPVESVARFAEQPEPAGPAVPLLDWPFSTASRADAVDEGVRKLAEEHEPEDLFTAAAEAAAQVLPGLPGSRLLATRGGVMRTTDYLVTRCVELVVHTDDLNAATGLSVPFDRQALAAAVRILADALAVKAPGASTEVRIPPFAVVQCVAGPRHTRGTPPNVVETQPLVWLRLATGRTPWSTALDAAEVSASGERADLSELLPLMN